MRNDLENVYVRTEQECVGHGNCKIPNVCKCLVTPNNQTSVALQRISDICQCILMGNKGMHLCVGCDRKIINMCNHLLQYAKDHIG